MKKAFLSVLSLAVVSTSSLFGDITLNEYRALQMLYNSTGGSQGLWSNDGGWNFSDSYIDPCNTNADWLGITCTDGHITRLSLDSNNLKGSIPAEIGGLTYLKQLDLENNALTGSIPTQIGNLTHLTYLNFSNNNLTGSIPTQIGALTSLKTLYLGNNNLTGIIPTQITNISSLRIFSLSDNNLTGIIPSGIENLSFNTLDEYNNKGHVSFINNYSLNTKVAGTIDFINQYQSHSKTYDDILQTNTQYVILQKLYETTNGDNWTNKANWQTQKNPCYPEIVISPMENGGVWKGVECDINGTVTSLMLNENNLKGSIPSDIGSLNKLEILGLNHNKLAGTIPSSITNLVKLEYLTLYNNCDLKTNDTELITFINNKYDEIEGNINYDYILNTNTHKCGNLSPIYYLLLN